MIRTAQLYMRLPLILAGGLWALSLTGCPKNPATGERQLILVSERQQIAMGREGAEQVRASIGLYPDSGLQNYVSGIGQRLAAASERPDLPWSFQIVDDPVVNAFALPGGFIFMTRGILTHFNSEAEMAAVLGHEIGHVTGLHSAERLSQAQAAQLGLGIGSILSPEVAQFGDVIGTGLGLLFLKFSRDHEREADDLGLRYMRRENYDPNEMVDVFAMLGRVSEAAGGSSLPGWLSTHPDPGERQERIRAHIDTIAGPVRGNVERDRYLRQLDGIVFGQNPRNGYFEDGIFLHPDLRFRVRFPDGWKTQNTAQAVVGISPEQDALIQLSFAEGASADAAARNFFTQQGIDAGPSRRRQINGLPSVWGAFGARTQQGSIRGIAAFVEFQDRVYQLLGYTAAGSIGRFEPVFTDAFNSFDRLTDRRALNVQPRRIEITRVDRSMTLEEFNDRFPSTIPLEELALINGIEPETTLSAGQRVKRVTGGPERGQ